MDSFLCPQARDFCYIEAYTHVMWVFVLGIR